MKVSELRQKNSNELQQLLLEQSKSQLKLRLQKGSGEPLKPHLAKNLRRSIARIHTVINQKERQS